MMNRIRCYLFGHPAGTGPRWVIHGRVWYSCTRCHHVVRFARVLP